MVDLALARKQSENALLKYATGCVLEETVAPAWARAVLFSLDADKPMLDLKRQRRAEFIENVGAIYGADESTIDQAKSDFAGEETNAERIIEELSSKDAFVDAVMGTVIPTFGGQTGAAQGYSFGTAVIHFYEKTIT